MDYFKVCPKCGYKWNSREEFIADENVEIIGYQPHFEYLQTGLFLFNHSCKTTFALEVKNFDDLYDGPVFKEKAIGSDDCPGYCLQMDNLGECHIKCECAYVREIIQVLKEREIIHFRNEKKV